MKNLNRFLEESNAIEGVYDRQSFLDAKSAWDYCIEHKNMSLEVVLGTHKILMQNQEIPDRYKGKFRDCPVYIGGKEGTEPSMIGLEILEWRVDMILHTQGTENDWKKLHINYENIHPFIDGNGRTGRIFMNWQRIKNGMDILVINESEKQEYYKWFRN